MESKSSKKLVVMSLSGKSKSYDISDNGEAFDLELIKAEFGDEPTIFSPSSSEDDLLSLDSVSTDNVLKGVNIDLPVPQPDNKDSILPDCSEEVVVSTKIYYKTGDYEKKRNYPVYVIDKDGKLSLPAFSKGEVRSGENSNHWIIPEIPVQFIQRRYYWAKTSSNRITGPQKYTQKVTATEGMSKTDTETFSMELGVEVKGLSAKVSRSISHSVTINESNSIEREYDIEVKENEIGVWTLWQLVEKFVFVDSENNPIEWTGQIYFKSNPLSIVSIPPIPGRFINGFENRLSEYRADLVIFNK